MAGVITADLPPNSWWNSPPIRQEIRHRIPGRIDPRKSLGNAASKLADWTVRSHRKPSKDKATIPVPSQGESPRDSVGIQPAESNTKLSLKSPTQNRAGEPV